jgi:hypothetical protein
MWNVFKIVDGVPQLLGKFSTFDQAGEAADLYRATFTDNSEIMIMPEVHE